MFPRGLCHNTTLYDYVCNCSSGYREISGMCSVCEPPSAIMFGSFAPQNSSYNVNATVTYSCVMG
uniref:Sushi domain-containing protein n=1 Tax=Ciona savignyi TaxID=51511 RepID=H2Y5T5_CIOSA